MNITCRAVLACVWMVLAASGCSNAVESPLLHLHFEPPSGVKLLEEVPGPPVVARFSGGLEIRRVVGTLAPPDEHQLEGHLLQALQLAGLPPVPVPVASARAGTCPLGAVARFDVRSPPNRLLIYVVPQGLSFLMLTFTQPANNDGKAEAQFERSLASLKALP